MTHEIRPQILQKKVPKMATLQHFTHLPHRLCETSENKESQSQQQTTTMASQSQQQTTTKPPLRKPTFVKVDQIKPGSNGHTLTAIVVSSTAVPHRGRGRNTCIAECVVGDETGTIIFTARNEQVDIMKPGTTVNLRNAKIDMFKNTMRLAVDKWGRIEVTEPASFTVNEENNVSLVEYELVNVTEEAP